MLLQYLSPHLARRGHEARAPDASIINHIYMINSTYMGRFLYPCLCIHIYGTYIQELAMHKGNKICICVYICIRVYIHIHIYIYIHTYTYIYIVCIYIYIYIERERERDRKIYIDTHVYNQNSTKTTVPQREERLFGLGGPQGNHGEDVKDAARIMRNLSLSLSLAIYIYIYTYIVVYSYISYDIHVYIYIYIHMYCVALLV